MVLRAGFNFTHEKFSFSVCLDLPWRFPHCLVCPARLEFPDPGSEEWRSPEDHLRPFVTAEAVSSRDVYICGIAKLAIRPRSSTGGWQ